MAKGRYGKHVPSHTVRLRPDMAGLDGGCTNVECDHTFCISCDGAVPQRRINELHHGAASRSCCLEEGTSNDKQPRKGLLEERTRRKYLRVTLRSLETYRQRGQAGGSPFRQGAKSLPRDYVGPGEWYGCQWKDTQETGNGRPGDSKWEGERMPCPGKRSIS